MSSTPTNPKVDFKRLRSTRGAEEDTLRDVVRDEVVDIDDVRLTYEQYPIIPFFDGSDATLQFLRKMRTLSNTAEACTNSIIRFVVGGGLTTEVARTPGFYRVPGGETHPPVTAEQDATFREFLASLNPVDDGDKLLEEIEQLTDNTLTYGNRWLCVRLTEVAGVRHAYLDAKDSEDVRYYATRPGEPRLALISESWSHDYLTKYPPQFVGVYPNITTDSRTGDRLTLIHDRERALKRKWYGLPRNLSALHDRKMEASQSEWTVGGYAEEWTANVLFETSGDEEDLEDPVQFAEQLDAMFTRKGAGKRWVHRHRLPGDEPMVVHELNNNQDGSFHDSLAKRAFDKIVRSYDWHGVLLSEQVPGQLGMSQQYLDIYRIKYATVIRPWQSRVTTTVNKGLALAAEWMGRKDVAGLSLGLGNMLADFMKEDAAHSSAPPLTTTPGPADTAVSGVDNVES